MPTNLHLRGGRAARLVLSAAALAALVIPTRTAPPDSAGADPGRPNPTPPVVAAPPPGDAPDPSSSWCPHCAGLGGDHLGSEPVTGAGGPPGDTGDTGDLAYETDYLGYDAATGAPATGDETPTVAPQTDRGYALLPYADVTRTGRTVRFHPGTPAVTRGHVTAAVNEINAIAGIGLRIGADTTTPFVGGEIMVQVVGQTRCGLGSSGCASSYYTVTPGFGKHITSTLVEIRSDMVGTGYEPGTARHELGHAIGLAHYDSMWEGEYQVMRARSTTGRDAYRAGDRNGLRHLAQGSTNPNVVGAIDQAVVSLGQVHLSGWTIDRDAPAETLAVAAFVNGAAVALALADGPRPDVARAYPGATTQAGFTVAVPARAGAQDVCVHAIGHRGQPVAIACRTVVNDGNPTGNLETARTAGVGAVQVSGWAIDPDVTDPRTVNVSVDGVSVAVAVADGVRPDVASTYPGQTPGKGFQVVTGGLRPGARSVCVSANNSGPGRGATLIGCRTVVVPGGNPQGSLDVARTAGPAAVRVGGWTLDGDTAEPTGVHTYVDGRFHSAAVADGVRPDVARAWPGFGDRRGFDIAVGDLPPGARQLCVFALNAGAGTANTLVGCRTVVVPGGNPQGSLDVARAAGTGVRAAGWALDGDTAGPVGVHVYVDGWFKGAYTADGVRGDVARAWPGFGDRRGFDVTVAVRQPGVRTVCVFAINAGAGTANTLLGCRAVAVGR
jgi:hypothetical protein